MNGIPIDPELVAAAKALDIDVALAAAQGVKDAVRMATTRRWREENGAALQAANDYVESNGLPLETYRLF